jgi:YegS/Rv2252/BmrU family lipid kinase
VDDGCELIVSVGGDGTIHEIVNGMVRNGKSEAALGVISVGSGNDFAYGLNLPMDPKKSIASIFQGKPHALDLACVEDNRGQSTIATNGIGIGFDASIAIEVTKISQVHGFAMYGLATLRTIAFYYQLPHMKISFDDLEVEQDVLMMSIGLGPRIGGGFYMTPDARHNDNLLDSCTVNPVGRLTMLWMLPKVMKGSHTTSHHVTMRRSQIIDLESDISLPIHVDGEIFAYHQDGVKQVKITTLPSALSLMY